MVVVLRWLPPLAAVAGAVAFVWSDAPVDIYAAQVWIESAGAAGPVLYLAGYVAAAMLFVPRPLLTMSGGMLFGAVFGTGLAVLGATLAALACFLVSRTTGLDVLRRRHDDGVLARIDVVLRCHGWLGVAFLRLLPVLPFSLVSYGCGLTAVRASHVAAGTALGSLPATALLVAAGGSVTDPTSPAFVVPVAVAALIPLAAVLLTRGRGTSSAPTPECGR